MASVRDQVEAYNYATRRQVLALLQGDDSVSVDPRRRLNRSLFGGLLLGVVVLAAAGVAGFLSGGGSTTLPSQGVIVDADTGAAYVRIGDVLHPTLNMTSAKLIAGHDITEVSSATLRTVPRGLPVGIPGAPEALPPSDQLTGHAWSVCTIAPQASAGSSQVQVSVGAPVPTPIPTGAGLVVQDPDQTEWLLDNGQRYQVSDAAATVLGLDQVTAMSVESEVLDAIPEGPPLDIPDIPGAGHPPSVSLKFTALVGDAVKVENGTNHPGLFVVMQDGVAPVDPFAFRLITAIGHNVTEPARRIVKVPAKTGPDIPDLWPRQALRGPLPPPTPNEPMCISYDPHAPRTAAAWPVTFSEPVRTPLGAHAVPVTASSGTLPTAATGVAVPPGGGALVRATGSGGVDAVYMLVTDSGLRFPIANADAVSRLGYDPSQAVSVPVSFLKLLPAGPGLDPTEAAVEYPGAAEPPPATATPSGVPS
ncbi:MAG TPA: type VII secretion protein EccB [Jatrophihabitans sp.]|jgi:type VII secretion protein EccB|nr:type VII secretion protein EccB [Jatrophihabitans sp.]